MKQAELGAGTVDVSTRKVTGAKATACADVLSVEEPVEVRLTADVSGQRMTQAVAVTMRTPGEDRELAAGFLFTEGIISEPGQIEEISEPDCNVVNVTLRAGVAVDRSVFERHSFVASSCGVCGKKSIDAVNHRRSYKLAGAEPQISAQVIHKLPALLRAAQASFASTGGIHASGLFEASGKLLLVREDVGRHNALDKLIGSELLRGALPLVDRILLVSGRASFELVQKAAHAGIPIMAAVGAPSSLAVELAQESGMTLLGFVRDERFNIYCGVQRIITAD